MVRLVADGNLGGNILRGVLQRALSVDSRTAL